MSLILED